MIKLVISNCVNLIMNIDKGLPYPVNPFVTRLKTTLVPENLFQCQINSDNLLRVPNNFDIT